MIPITEFLIIAIAVYRLTMLITNDKILEGFRDRFLEWDYNNPEDDTYVPKNLFGYLIHCHWCVSVWSALFLYILYQLSDWSYYLIIILALSGLSSIVNKILEKS